MGLFITILIFALVVWLAFYIINNAITDPPMNKIARVIVGVIALIYLIQMFLPGPYGGYYIHYR